ncbi:protein phosphatase 2C domain-containing protein [Streptomyces coacervatus]|uniref:Protein phosphatase 2C domain-containing protein n=1 Tax=Streptomyces coacervatus TaxID=647381 RepID=A0ABP7H973_9ACTN|nr:protein phosphatase 2C domain-containing protein [Streptomyces coacervatus]MDF2267701.1 protein phosphatase 2C domain-containing protein [Streptomyces coacervatus]
MSQQGGSPTGHEDDWWGQLYDDDSTGDTGPAPAPDTVDDRFASVAGAVGADAGAEAVDEGFAAGAGVPAQRPGDAEAAQAPPRAGLAQPRAPWERPPAAPGGRTSTEDPVTTVPESRMPAEAPPPPSTPPDGADAAPAPDGSPTAAAGQADPDAAPAAERRARHAADAPSAVAADSPLAHAARHRATPPAPEADPLQGSAPARTATHLDLPPLPPAPVDYVGSGPPTYDAEPTALPPADPDDLDDLVADTVLDGARYGACTLRAVSVRGDSARYRGEPRRDSLLTARFGTGEHALILVAMATGARATPGAHRAAAEACHWIGRAVGRSHARLAEDIRAARRGDLKSGLHRLTDRSLGKLRASAAEQGIEPEEYAATLRCLLLPADPECRTRVFFGVGAGGLFRLRDGDWQDIEPRVSEVTGEPVVGFGSLPPETPEGDRLTMDLGITTPPSPYDPAPEPSREPFRFRASVAHPGDALLMCTGGLAEPLRGEPDLCRYLTTRWSGPTPPGLAAFLADTQVRVKGYADDRTAAAVWEA